MSVVLQVKKLSEHAQIPRRGTSGAAGYDLFAAVSTTILPGHRQLISTDISMAIPPGNYGRIASRSSLALKGIDVAGGVVDSDYRGCVGVILVNNSKVEFVVERGNRIAQIIIEKIITPDVEVVDELSDTQRGEGGWGSTGK